MTHRLALLLAMALGVTPVGALAQASVFEGAVTMRLGIRGGATSAPMPTQAEYLVRGDKVRMNIGTGTGSMSVLSLPQEKKLYLLMAAQQAYAEIPVGAASARAATMPEPTVIRTGRMETVAGMRCEHVLAIIKADTTDTCLTRELGTYVNPMEAMRGASMPAWQRAMAGGGFPLKVTLGDGTVATEVTKVERKRLANDLFAVPLSYTKMDMPRGRAP